MTVILRSRTFYLVRRVPRRYLPVEDRERVWISLHTDSPSEADRKASSAWETMLHAWEALLIGDRDACEARMQAARNLAAMHGHAVVPAFRAEDRCETVVEKPPARMPEATPAPPCVPDDPSPPNPAPSVAQEAPACKDGGITVNEALRLYWELAADRTMGMSPDQERRWRNPRMKAVRNFVDIVGDKPISEITADDMLAFRAWWLDRVREQDLTANSANKDFTHLGDILRTVNRMKRLRLDLPLGDMAIKDRERAPRPGFSETWIRTRLLAPGALAGMNDEARVIFLAMINTGARPSEIANLTASRIRLDADIPHISIAPEDRVLKTRNARRLIPLTGVSLDALRTCPSGFPRYRDNPSLSATQVKFLRENGLLESPDHTVYSLRHSFETRMIAAGIDDRIRRDLFGHTLNRERYGEVGLPVLLEAVQKVAI